MKYFSTIVLSALIFLNACNGTSDAHQLDNQTEALRARSDVPVMLHDLGIGPIKVGMTEKQIEELGLQHKKETVNIEGDEYIKYLVTIENEKEAVAMMKLEGRVYLVKTTSPAIKDEYGNGVGSNIEDLKTSYPSGRLIKGYADGNYLRFLTATPLIFLLDKSQVPENCFEFNAECDFSKYPKVIELEIGEHSPK